MARESIKVLCSRARVWAIGIGCIQALLSVVAVVFFSVLCIAYAMGAENILINEKDGLWRVYQGYVILIVASLVGIVTGIIAAVGIKQVDTSKIKIWLKIHPIFLLCSAVGFATVLGIDTFFIKSLASIVFILNFFFAVIVNLIDSSCQHGHRTLFCPECIHSS